MDFILNQSHSFGRRNTILDQSKLETTVTFKVTVKSARKFNFLAAILNFFQANFDFSSGSVCCSLLSISGLVSGINFRFRSPLFCLWSQISVLWYPFSGIQFPSPVSVSWLGLLSWFQYQERILQRNLTLILSQTSLISIKKVKIDPNFFHRNERKLGWDQS